MAMGTGASDNSLGGPRDRNRPKLRSRRSRRARVHRADLDLESLETRALMATIPAASPTGSLQNISQMMGNLGGATGSSQNSAVVAVDPHNSSKLVAVWQDNNPVMAAATNNGEVVALEAAYSVDSGQTWLPLFSEPTNVVGLRSQEILLNPTTSGPTVPYNYQLDPKLGFDDSDQFYLLTTYADALTTPGSGALALQRWDFSGSTPVAYDFSNNEQDPALYSGFPSTPPDVKVIYQWYSTGNDQITDPTLTVDDNQATLPPSVNSQIDPNSGNVYVSWTSIDVPANMDGLVPPNLFNYNRILTVVSSDGGNDFSPPTITDVNSQNENDTNGQQVLTGEAGPGNGPTSDRDFNPAITVSQGRTPTESGLSGDPGIPGGTVTVSWDNAGSNTLMANTLTPGHDNSFGNQQTLTVPQIGTATTKIPVNMSNLTDLDSLDVRVDLIDPTDQYLGLVLIAPDGQQFTLVDAGILTGANVGVQTYTMNNIGDYELGTIFDDNATRVIGADKSQAAPYFGDFAADGGSLRNFLQSVASKGAVNGTWTLETLGIDTSTSASPGFLLDWSLSFGRGLTPDNDVVIPGSNGLVLPISATTGLPLTIVPASPVAIGPGVVMAEDNTMGPDSPFEGRLYAAFVGYENITTDGVKNPTYHTDIYLTYSDDGGRTWSPPEIVDEDSADINGSSGGNNSFNNPDVYTGRTHFQPAIAVDPVTGTLVVSWRDASSDPNNTLVFTYMASSIDGGASFSPQSYANPALTATDSIDTQTTVALSPEGDNGTATNTANSAAGFGTSMGLAVYDGQVYSVWTGNLDQASVVNNAPALDGLAALFRPMAIAAGPRIINSTMGPIPLAEAASGKVTFNVTFDRPLNPPDQNPSFTPADIQVFYHDTTNGDPSIPLEVLSVAPVTSSGVGNGNKFGYTEFTVTFDPALQPGGGPSGIGNYTGTYSYLITPDDGSGDPIVAPVQLLRHHADPPAGHRADRLDAGAPADPHLGHGRHQHRGRLHELQYPHRQSRQPAHHGDRRQPVADPPERRRPADHPDGPRRPDRVGLPGHRHRPAHPQQRAVRGQRPRRRPG